MGTDVLMQRGRDRLWTDGAEYLDEKALSVTVNRLRRKLDAADVIRTFYGIGYVWSAKGL